MSPGTGKYPITITVLSFLFFVITAETTANIAARQFGLPTLGHNIIYSSILLAFALLAVAVSKKWEFLRLKVDNPVYLVFLLPEFIYILVFGIGYGGFQTLPSNTVLILSIGVIVGVLPEEIFFRGVYHDYLRPTGKIKALIVLSVIFSLYHFTNGIGNIIHTFLIAALYFLLREKFKTIWPLIFIHIYNNLSLKFIDFEAVGAQQAYLVIWILNASLAISIAILFYINWAYSPESKGDAIKLPCNPA